MFISMKFAVASHCNPSLLFHQHHHHQGFGDFSGGSSLRRRTSTLKLQTTLCSTYTNDNAYELSSANSHEGSKESAESKKGESSTSNEYVLLLL
ncbi:hypothetical protein Ahy_B10g106218 [Arachis hypogaea]|uniref:Uncharacterized protein n=1 Tax=Arachis hypogaea TaxID=3818 RepID=A0A444XA46_ARAHY|nr:hypothetical protein Ahy_B10g106218 [Arachis hypogaea]